jgi:hypothetical protein
VPGIEDVIVTAKAGREILALPEGSTYLGFMFARAETAAEVERALRDAFRMLRIEVAAKIPVVAS